MKRTKCRLPHLRNIFTIAVDSTRHQIMVTTEVLRSRVIDYIRTKFKGTLQERAHHGIVNNDDSFWNMTVDHIGDGLDIYNLKQRICRRLKKDIADLAVGLREQWKKCLRLRRVDMMDWMTA